MPLTRLPLTTGVSGTLPIANGGTNVTTAADLANTGNLVLISTATASSDITVAFTTGIDNTYEQYKVIITNCHPATDQVDLKVAFTTDGTNFDEGITGIAFKSYNDGVTSALTTEPDSKTNSSADNVQIVRDVGNDNDQHCDVELDLYNPASTTFEKNFVCRAVFNHYANYTVYHLTNGFIETTSAVTGLRFNFSSGNIDAGTFKLYGVK